MKRYGEMTREELLAEVDKLKREKKGASFPSQAEMLERKIKMAESYLLSPDSFPPGTYEVEGSAERFELRYVNGVMAWGTMGREDEASFPLSMLKRIETD
ncbi:DUF1811 family protein [Paenibacillus flagellatus]|uniref:Transcriptional regulator n=1 Tax=Paenibacillus flagellatus TaxID=2211139 RepID=A0A2V5KIW3_9BACL|nr:DUF1811 family protein [Paenibacillus flagellatus]PYI54490.1 transcriptional regulator [Paenibacillus flagellatus]